ncbi:MAG: ABC transporter ATP-binding protein [Anaerolineales bacterium]|nr:ABC transporter ATP-binding protein [Anaerolineales bacterium]
MLLSVKGLAVSYGAIQALHGISFEVEEGEMLTLIGANGAGKSTTLWTIVGQIGELGGRVVAGGITYKGENLLGYSASQIVRKFGITLVPEGRRIFGNLTILENLKLAAFARSHAPRIAQDLERVFAIFPRLDERKHQLADLLSGGEQQMLAVGRAVMARGQLMLLDEPSMGLSPLLVKGLFKTLHDLNQQGTTMLLVEQNAHLALRYATRAYVLETGNVVLSGPAQDVAQDPQVKKAYLGE